MDKVGLGVLSTANIGRKILRTIKWFVADHIDIVALGSRDLERSRAFILEAGLPETTTSYGSYQEVLDDPRVVAVYMPLPSCLHVEWLRKSMQAGKHVLMEKPICKSHAEVAELSSICSAHPHLVLMDGTMWLHNPRRQVIEDALRGGALGAVRHVYTTFCFNLLGRGVDDIRLHKELDGLGCLGDVGWYCVGAALWAMSYSRPDHVLAHPGSVFNEEGVPITLGATIVWADGRRADVHCGFHAAFIQDLAIVGETGVARMSDAFLPRADDHSEYEVLMAGTKDVQTKKVPTAIPQEACMLRDFADMVRAARGGQLPGDFRSPGLPLAWTDVSFLTQTVVCAILDSAQDGCKAVKV